MRIVVRYRASLRKMRIGLRFDALKLQRKRGKMVYRNGDTFCLDLSQILTYFDTNPDDGHHNATPLRGLFGEDLAIALLKHYFEVFKNNTAKVIFRKRDDLTNLRHEPNAELPAKTKLDCWLRVDPDIYQVEIKFYAPGASGWKKTPISHDHAMLREIAEWHWAQRWDIKKNAFKHCTEGKVLLKMRLPADCLDLKPQPLICYWGFLQEGGDLAEPLFKVAIGELKISAEQSEKRDRNPEFDSVWVFSMSAYIRKLLMGGQKTINLELPELAARLTIINKFFVDLS
jgi:hypothetical protein